MTRINYSLFRMKNIKYIKNKKEKINFNNIQIKEKIKVNIFILF